MVWRLATKAVMEVACTVMGEKAEITREGESIAVNPLTLIGIFERATNFDETGVNAYANIENFKAMVDFKTSDLIEAPKRGDLVFIPGSNESFIVFEVAYDGWARYRCLLEDA